MIMLIIYNDYELEKSMKCKICGQRIDSPDCLITKDYNYGGDEEIRYLNAPIAIVCNLKIFLKIWVNIMERDTIAFP